MREKRNKIRGSSCVDYENSQKVEKTQDPLCKWSTTGIKMQNKGKTEEKGEIWVLVKIRGFW